MDISESKNDIQQRRLMVEHQLRHRDITDESVLEVMAQLPRQHFIPTRNRDDAYLDQPVSIGEGQTISQPYIVALMSEKLRLRPEHLVLEIGTGCGYQTAILARVVRRVYTIERLDLLSQQARKNLIELGIYNVEYHIGDGSLGWPRCLTENSNLPPRFDRIMVTAAAETMPNALVDQLADQGRMVIPVGKFGYQELLLVEKHDQKIRETLLCHCRFVKLIQE